jgi:dTDP-4-amino-4,6-dideoxygalactose transaminase
MIPFIDLQAQRLRLGGKIEAAVQESVVGGAWVMGPQVRQFEADLAAFGKAKHALGCANGTDALALPLMAWEIGRGDAVFVPSFTFAATAEVVPWFDAEPVFVDVDENTYNMDPAALERAIEGIKAEGRLTPRVVIAVDLFGQPADYPAIKAVCDKHGLKLISDSAQGFGCTIGGEHPLKWADITTTSFFPAKPLGAYGDAGAVLTRDAALHERMVSLRVHGQAVGGDLADLPAGIEPKYLNMRVGLNARMDALQAAWLSVKLPHLDAWNAGRRAAAERYHRRLAAVPGVDLLPVRACCEASWHLFVVGVERRDALAAYLAARGIGTGIHYPVPIHLQPAMSPSPRPGRFPVAERLAGRILSLPMFAGITAAEVDAVCDAVAEFGP